MIFIDTGAFLARYVERDQFHDRATERWQKLQDDGQKCLTSNLVLSEAITLLARRTNYEFAVTRARNIYDSTFLSILRPDASDETAAPALMQKYADQSVSFTDCVSFVLMEKLGVERAFSFDRHFAMAGFDVEP